MRNEVPHNDNVHSSSHHHDYLSEGDWISLNERRSKLIIILTFSTMVVELICGYLTHSMALLADGWHMASHAGALLITYLTYVFAKSPVLKERFTFGTGKFIPLGGYTNAIILAGVAIVMLVESVNRFFSPEVISYNEALLISCLGLLVNLTSAFILGRGNEFHTHSHGASHDQHHGHKEDHNIRSAYFHVLADVLTSVLAIGALLAGKYFDSSRIDSFVGVIGSFIVLRWAYTLSKDAAWDLLDGHSKTVCRETLVKRIEEMNAKVIDIHIWSIGPGINACEVILKSTKCRGPSEYKKLIQDDFGIRHVIVEEWGD